MTSHTPPHHSRLITPNAKRDRMATTIIGSRARRRARANAPTRYHPSTAYLLLFYLPLIIIPWVVQCVLDVKPMTRAGSSYIANQGEYSPRDLAAVGSWMRAARVLNMAAAILAVPTVSAILAHAAVVMVHRRNPARPLNLRKLLSLADDPWRESRECRTGEGVGLSLLGSLWLH